MGEITQIPREALGRPGWINVKIFLSGLLSYAHVPFLFLDRDYSTIIQGKTIVEGAEIGEVYEQYKDQLLPNN